MPISAHGRVQLQASSTAETFIILLSIIDPITFEVIRVSSDATTRISDDPLLYATISRGNQYIALPFNIDLPTAGGESPPRARIVIENVGQELTTAIRSTNIPAELLVEVVTKTQPDTVERSFPNLRVLSAFGDEMQIVLELGLRRGLIEEPYPYRVCTPGAFPGLQGL